MWEWKEKKSHHLNYFQIVTTYKCYRQIKSQWDLYKQKRNDENWIETMLRTELS